MKKKICFIVISVLIIVPLISFAADSFGPNIDINSIMDGLLSGGQTVSPNIIVNKFELSWSTDTYTPIDYIGRALPTPGSEIFVDADVKTSDGSAKNLKYSWFLEDIFQQNKSGYGKSSFSFYAQKYPGSNQTVRIQIFNEDRTIFQEKTIEIPITQTEVVLSTNIVNKDSVVARPYFFSINKLTDLEFQWTLTGQEPIISSNYNASILNISVSNKNTNATAEQQLWLSVKNLKETEQSAYNSIKINL